ncbi:MAG: NERD domain-containing serine/threonine-protein kinase [Thermaerobacter sp.]|nr:NERD domain-containing serine/threonine-protein kinase [Thermaerobacter sp.]
MARLLLKGLRGREDGPWFIYTNIMLKASQGRRLEVDQLVVGPSGVFVVEVKHWDEVFIKENPATVEEELQKLEMKARIASGPVKRLDANQWVSGVMLLTKPTGKIPGIRRRYPQVFSQEDWSLALRVDESGQLDPVKIQAIARELGGPEAAMVHGSLRRLGEIINLELISPREELFHRVYVGVHRTKREKRIVHSYDLSASPHKVPLRLAEREWGAMQEMVRHPFVPIIVDSFQAVSNYAGEMYFFSVVAPDAPTLDERATDEHWLPADRLEFATRCAEALATMHEGGHTGKPVVHRGLSPSTILVRGGNHPMFTGFQWARLDQVATIAAGADEVVSDPWMAPEVAAGGLGQASAESDVFSLCKSLRTLFVGHGETETQVRECLEAGMGGQASDRCSAAELAERLRELILPVPPLAEDPDEVPSTSIPVAPKFWAADDEIVTARGEHYLVLAMLGQGANGTSYKVMEVRNGEQHGPFVAKVMRDREMGTLAVDAYRRVRPYSVVPSLASVHEVASSWDPNQPVAVLQWVEGVPLQSIQGVIELQAEEEGISQDELLLGWLEDLCKALAVLHRVGYVHGDVSLSNIIVQGRRVVLTDYDTVTRGHEHPVAATPGLRPPGAEAALADASYDMYALGVTLFQAMFEPAPSRPVYAEGGLNWDAVEESDWERAAAFVRRATDPDAARRFRDADDGLRFLCEGQGLVEDIRPAGQPFGWNEAPRLLELLGLYPGSRHGNAETRGLDSAFAESTYIETELDRVLRDDIQHGDLNLVVLLGNAGDGKTALLQHLVHELGLTPPRSADRIWKQSLPDGRELMINLDGSASYREKTSAELLDELFEPFHDRNFSPHRVRLVAINSGPLRAWLERFANGEDTWLTSQLRAALLGRTPVADSRIRILDLNQRSLVGSLHDGGTRADFLEQLIGVLVDGPNPSADLWTQCRTCSAQAWCSPYQSVRTLRDPVQGKLVRQRLTEALQAVHHRGTVHITTRELRATVSYVLFGTDTCQEIHQQLADSPVSLFATRAFDPESPHRQGEVLAELTLLDPALVAEPEVDRQLLARGSGSKLEVLRRQSYFLDHPDAASLVGGAHLDLFRRVGHMTRDETDALCQRLVRGLSALDDLPRIALEQSGGVSLRVPARTATESVFWVEKPYEGFSLSVPPSDLRGVPTLHTEVSLAYTYDGGQREHLEMGLELFSLLLEVEEGFRPGFDLRSADTHARLSIFAQRLAQEQRRHYFAWNPSDSRQVYAVDVDRVEENGNIQQVLSVRPRAEPRHG